MMVEQIDKGEWIKGNNNHHVYWLIILKILKKYMVNYNKYLNLKKIINIDFQIIEYKYYKMVIYVYDDIIN